MQSKAGIRAAVSKLAAISAAVALVVASASVQARAIDLQQLHQFEIPSEALSAALTAFSAQSLIHLVTSGVPAGVLSSEVKGDLSTLDALSALLRGTGLAFRQVDAGTLVVVTGAVAQLRATQFQLVGEADANALADQPTAGAPAAAAPSELSEVQVTGTRIIRQGYEAPTPVTAVGLQTLQDVANANIGDTLNELPVFQGSTTNQSSNISNGSGQTTQLNLRNLGSNRNLILFDGRRLPSQDGSGVPDIDLIPDALVQRVDVVTGGASAVYGSDAVAGVINYVLDTNFTGVKGLIQGGESGYGDGQNVKVQLSAGTTFLDGRLHVLVSADKGYQAEIPGYDRPWNVSQALAITNPGYKSGGSAPNYIFESCCVSSAGYYPGGLILSGPLLGTDFGTGGTVGQYNYGVGLTSPGAGDSGGDWASNIAGGAIDILGSDNTQHYFARLGFDITPSLQAYAEFVSALDHTVSRCCPNYYPTGIGTLYTNNPFIPASVVSQAAAAGVTSFSMATTIWDPPGNGDGIGAPGGAGEEGWGIIGGVDDRTIDMYVLGLKGSFTAWKSTWSWGAYGQQGLGIIDDLANGANKSNLLNSIEAVRVGSYGGNTSYSQTPNLVSGAGLITTTVAPYTAANFPNPLGIPAGQVTCASNLLPLSNPAATSNCAPSNIFGLGLESSASINYTQGWAQIRQVFAQNIVGGDISGEPFSTWAGPVSVALDAEYRHEAVGGNSDANSRVGNWFSVNYFAFDGSRHVEEGALETVIPLLKGVPGVQELDLNGAARATEYSTSGYVTTYKYGLEYTPINDLRLRAVYSEDIRAPTLSNLYAMSSGHGTDTDPFFNQQVPATGITGNNTSLLPEKAHQYELGLVIQPAELPGLNLSVDYYHISLSEAISSLSAAYELLECYATRIPGTLTGTSPLCGLIVRNPNGSLVSVETIPINIANFLVSGVDYQGDYRKNLTEVVSSWKGAFDLHISATETLHDITNTGIAGPTQILDGVGYGSVPRWAVYGTLTYDLDPWRFVWTERYDSSVQASNTYIICPTNCPTAVPAGFTTVGWNDRYPTYFLAGLSVTYKFLEQTQQEAEAFVSVNNLFNKIPYHGETTSFYAYSVNTNLALYDAVGTNVHAGVRFRF